MSNTMSLASDENTKSIARGMGAWHQRRGLSRDITIGATVKEHPGLAGYEMDIAKGWNAAKRGRV